MLNYRSEARRHFMKASEELNSGDDERLKYAALELRLAIEGLTYDRATAYSKELPPEEFETWQPKKLMNVLLEIDPSADSDSALSVGLEETYGVQASVMDPLGKEIVFNLGMLRKHYDALGSYLHVPTLKQAQGALPSPAKLRERCTSIAAYIEKVLASPVWNVTLGQFATIECHCGATIRKRIPHGANRVVAECTECLGSYAITHGEGDAVVSAPEVVDVNCAHAGCGHVMKLFRRELTRGTGWVCQACKGHNHLELGVVVTPADRIPAKAGTQ